MFDGLVACNEEQAMFAFKQVMQSSYAWIAHATHQPLPHTAVVTCSSTITSRLTQQRNHRVHAVAVIHSHVHCGRQACFCAEPGQPGHRGPPPRRNAADLVHTTNNNEKTALHLAARSMHISCVRAILRAGTDRHGDAHAGLRACLDASGLNAGDYPAGFARAHRAESRSSGLALGQLGRRHAPQLRQQEWCGGPCRGQRT